MPDIRYDNTNHDPEMRIDVDFSTKRSGKNVTITATVTESFLPPTYSETGLYYGWTLTFNMKSGSVSNSVTIKNKNEWYAHDEMSRTKSCSITLSTTSSSASVTCSVTTSMSQYAAGTMPTQRTTVSLPAYRAPSTPTTISISPNPCAISGRPTVTWSGATAGSAGRIYYDLERRCTKSNGSWTSWERVLTNTRNTSYQSAVLSGLTVSGQSPFVGIQYQYRVRSTDNGTTTSSWKVSSNLSVSFTSPTAPTTITWDDSQIKQDTLIIRWSGASGGSGSITQYQVDTRWYDNTTSTWSDWTTTYTGTSTSCTLTLLAAIGNSDQIQARIRTQNSWSQWSSYRTSSSYIVRANQLWFKVNGNWVSGSVYIKVNGNWVEGMPYVKVNNTWYESL